MELTDIIAIVSGTCIIATCIVFIVYVTKAYRVHKALAEQLMIDMKFMGIMENQARIDEAEDYE
jgi:hypothetical protein